MCKRKKTTKQLSLKKQIIFFFFLNLYQLRIAFPGYRAITVGTHSNNAVFTPGLEHMDEGPVTEDKLANLDVTTEIV